MLRILLLLAWSVLGHSFSPAQIELDSFGSLQSTLNSQRRRQTQFERSREGRQDDSNRPKVPISSTTTRTPTKVPDPIDQCEAQPQPKSPPIPTRNDTLFQNIKHDNTFSDISTPAPTRFSDMGYLLFGYDLYKGNLLTFGFDPGFRHPLFDYGKIEDYMLTLDARHMQPPGTSALPSQACTATLRQTVIQTEEDLQERQGSIYEETRGFSFDGSELADAIPETAAKNPKVQAIVGAVKTLKANHASMNNDEYKDEITSASREDTTTIIAEAECNIYQAKLNQQAPPPLLPEVKAWIIKMLDIQKTGQKKKLREEIIKFLDYYGTHIAVEINFGARYMYNFTLTSKNEAELTDNFKSFKSGVSNQLNFLGFGTSSKRDKSSEQALLRKTRKFEEIVETSVKSVGAPLPPIKADGSSPDSEAWAKSSFENPVPVKIKLVGIQNIFNEQLLGKGFIEESACKNEIEKADFENLQEEFVLMLPRKAVTACKSTEKHCESVKLKGKELDRVNKLFECAQVAIQFQGLEEEGKGNKFSGLLDVLTTGATDEEKMCLEKSKVIEKLTTSFDAIKTHLDVNLYNLLGPGQGGGGIFKLILTVADGSKAGDFLELIGVQTNQKIPTRCRSVLDKFLRGDVGALVRNVGDEILNFFTGTSKEEEEEMAECMIIAENIKKKKILWDKYGMKILEGLKPENLAKDCFSKTRCCTVTRLKACTKIAGLKNSYAEALSKRGGIPEDVLLLIPESGDIEEMIKEEVKKGIKTMETEKAPCKTCEEDPKDEELEECKKDDDEEGDKDSSTQDDDDDDDDPCEGNQGKIMAIDCCKIDPRKFGRNKEGGIPCDDCKSCSDCTIVCLPLNDAEKEERAKKCSGKQKGEEIEVKSQLGTLIFPKCP